MGVVCSPLFHIIPSQLTCEFQASRVWPQMTNRSNSYTHMAKIDALYNGYFPKYGNNRFWTVHISLTLSMVTLHCLVCGSSIPGLFQTSSGLLPFLEDTVSIDDYRYLLIFHFPEHWIFFLNKITTIGNSVPDPQSLDAWHVVFHIGMLAEWWIRRRIRSLFKFYILVNNISINFPKRLKHV